MLQQELCDKLINTLFAGAQQRLTLPGTFDPFGVAITAAGELASVGVYREQPEPDEIIDLLASAFRERHADQNWCAIGICADVRLVPPRPTGKFATAVLAGLEDASGAVNLYLPYRRQASGRIVYRGLVSIPVQKTIFVHDYDQSG